ncbi:CGNR zinc finger domain-containing protein [Streptomyces sp. HNM0574]|nr:CGNR zinc finger domain-containing protein [Streptomyces sp. HNM0574]
MATTSRTGPAVAASSSAAASGRVLTHSCVSGRSRPGRRERNALAASEDAADVASRKAPWCAEPSTSSPSSGPHVTSMPTPTKESTDVNVARARGRARARERSSRAGTTRRARPVRSGRRPLLGEHQRPPGGVCASPRCDHVFVALGSALSRRFCSRRCATRERVAAHRRSRANDPAD